MKNYHFAIFIGRFQPYHNGHHHVIKQGLTQAEKVIVLCGSAYLSPSHRNPWSFNDRKAMILNSFSKEESEKIIVLPLLDSPYNEALWLQSVHSVVSNITQSLMTAPKVTLIGSCKNHSGFYVKMFPQWHAIEVNNIDPINATALRTAYFSEAENFSASEKIFNMYTPQGTQQFFAHEFSQSAFESIFTEHVFVENYKKQWHAAPYPPIFVTVDAVVIQSGHILLIKRKASPGKGLAALPGGFLDPDEQLLDACIRELHEETKLAIPETLLRGCIKRTHTFDNPYRSARGRTITHAFLIELPACDNLPTVTGSDDAEKAFWMPLGEIKPEKLFEDHYFIVKYMLGG
jgi:bifunctional NMN adenylyltransferase/nudix hydrolase